MNKYFFLLLLLAFIPNHAQCQELPVSSTKKIGVRIGFKNPHIKDQLYSPLSLSGYNLSYQIRYENLKQYTKQQVAFSYSGGTTQHRSGNFISALTDVQLQYRFQFKISENSENSISVGPNVSSKMLLLDYRSFTSATWLGLYNLGLSSSWHHQINDKQSLVTGVNYGLLALIARPPWGGFDEEVLKLSDSPQHILFNRSKLKSFLNYFNFNISISYSYHISDRLFCDIEWNFVHLAYKTPKSLKTFSNQLVAGLDYKF